MVSAATLGFQALLDAINAFDPAKKMQALAIINPIVFPGGQPAGTAGVDAAVAALASAGFFTPASAASVDVPALMTGGAQENANLIFPTGTTAGTAPAQPGDIDVALGSALRQQEFENLLLANKDRRATIDQQVSIATFLAEAERASPTRAAAINAALGLGTGGIDFGFADAFLGGGQLQVGQGGFSTGVAGGQNVALPNSLSLNQLSFLEANPVIARFIADLGDFLGKPDIFGTSIAGAIPTSGALAGLAA